MRAGPRISTDRMEAFSDGVFAIAITLLVLDLSVPSGSGDRLLAAIGEQWPRYLAYVVSFATIGAIWLSHNAITEYLERADAWLLRANLLLLMVVSFIPFPTHLAAEYIHHEDAERVAVTFYGACFLLASVLVAVLWRYARREQFIRIDVKDEELELLSQRLAPALGGYVVMLALGILVPIAALFGYLAIAILFVVPFRLPWSRGSQRRTRAPTRSGDRTDSSVRSE